MRPVQALKDATRPTRRWIESAVAPYRARRWKHSSAQAFELKFSRLWLEGKGREYLTEIKSASKTNAPGTLVDEFFAGDKSLWREFADSLDGKTLLDVGCGPTPFAGRMPWAGRRIAIDPLIGAYDHHARSVLGCSTFEGIECFSQNAETFIPALEGKVDGAIICRNTLDHQEFPAIALANLASYAAPGCKLLLWTDVVHPYGGDIGHHNIAPDAASLARLVINLGFSLIRNTPDVCGQVSWGCLAVKR